MNIQLKYDDKNNLIAVIFYFDSNKYAKSLSSYLATIPDEEYKTNYEDNPPRLEITSFYKNQFLDAYLSTLLGNLYESKVCNDFNNLKITIEQLFSHYNIANQMSDVILTKLPASETTLTKLHAIDQKSSTVPSILDNRNELILKNTNLRKEMEKKLQDLTNYYLKNNRNLDNKSQEIFTEFHSHLRQKLEDQINRCVNRIRTDQELAVLLNDKKFLEYLIKNSSSTPEYLIKSILINPDSSFVRYIFKQPSEYLPPNINRIAIYRANSTMNNLIMEITNHNNEKTLMTPNVSNTAWHEIFLSIGAIYDQSSERRNIKIISASEWVNLSLYNSREIYNDYVNIHKKITQEFIEFIKTKESPIEILFIGCGQGNEMVDIVKFLKKNNISYIIYGIDNSQENIETAKKNPAFQDSNIFFMTGNADQIDEHIKKFRLYAEKMPIQPKTLVTISSGFLTREVIIPRKAHEIFQKISSFSNVIFISGRTENLIQRRDAKNCGMDITHKIYYSNDDLRAVDRYEFKDINQQANDLIRAISKQQHGEPIQIKLIGHARPVDLIKKIKELQPELFEKKLIIQLHGAYIDQNDIKYIADLINHSNKKISIISSGLEPWCNTLTSSIKSDLIENVSSYFFSNPIEDERKKISEKLAYRTEQHIKKNN